LGLSMISIPFAATDGTYTLTDAIVLPDDHGMSDEQIEQMKRQRLIDWIAFVTTPPVEIAEEPSPPVDEQQE